MSESSPICQLRLPRVCVVLFNYRILICWNIQLEKPVHWKILREMKTFEFGGIQNSLFATKYGTLVAHGWSRFEELITKTQCSRFIRFRVNASIVHRCGRYEERIFRTSCLRFIGFIFYWKKHILFVTVDAVNAGFMRAMGWNIARASLFHLFVIMSDILFTKFWFEIFLCLWGYKNVSAFCKWPLKTSTWLFSTNLLSNTHLLGCSFGKTCWLYFARNKYFWIWRPSK